MSFEFGDGAGRRGIVAAIHLPQYHPLSHGHAAGFQLAREGVRYVVGNEPHPNIERIPLPRYETKLPVILSREEVKALLEAPKNLGHRAILATLYGAGLRVSEATNLRVADLDRDRKLIHVRGGKGYKDRQVMLPEQLREVLAAYWRWKRPTEWLFPGENPGCPIARKSVFEACKKAAQRAGIAKSVHPHSLRHAFARTCSTTASAWLSFKPCSATQT